MPHSPGSRIDSSLLCVHLAVQRLLDRHDKLFGSELLHIGNRRDQREIACHFAGFDRLQRRLVQKIREPDKFRDLIQLSSFSERNKTLTLVFFD